MSTIVLNEQQIADGFNRAIQDAVVDGIKTKFNVKGSDIEYVKRLMKNNPELDKKAKECKSVKDVMKLMKSKEFKEATAKEDEDDVKANRKGHPILASILLIALVIYLMPGGREFLISIVDGLADALKRAKWG